MAGMKIIRMCLNTLTLKTFCLFLSPSHFCPGHLVFFYCLPYHSSSYYFPVLVKVRISLLSPSAGSVSRPDLLLEDTEIRPEGRPRTDRPLPLGSPSSTPSALHQRRGPDSYSPAGHCRSYGQGRWLELNHVGDGRHGGWGCDLSACLVNAWWEEL